MLLRICHLIYLFQLIIRVLLIVPCAQLRPLGDLFLLPNQHGARILCGVLSLSGFQPVLGLRVDFSLKYVLQVKLIVLFHSDYWILLLLGWYHIDQVSIGIQRVLETVSDFQHETLFRLLCLSSWGFLDFSCCDTSLELLAGCLHHQHLCLWTATVVSMPLCLFEHLLLLGLSEQCRRAPLMHGSCHRRLR